VGNAEEKLTARMPRRLDFLWQEWKHLPLQMRAWARILKKSPTTHAATADRRYGKMREIYRLRKLVRMPVLPSLMFRLHCPL